MEIPKHDENTVIDDTSLMIRTEGKKGKLDVLTKDKSSWEKQ